MTSEPLLLELLVHDSDSTFRLALPKLKRVIASGDIERADFVVDIARALDASGLRDRERHLRLQRILQALELDKNGFQQLAEIASNLSSSMRAAIVGLLPSELRVLA